MVNSVLLCGNDSKTKKLQNHSSCPLLHLVHKRSLRFLGASVINSHKGNFDPARLIAFFFVYIYLFVWFGCFFFFFFLKCTESKVMIHERPRHSRALLHRLKGRYHGGFGICC